MFNYFKSKIKKISSKFIKFKYALGASIKALFRNKIDESSLEELEKLLYEADLGVEVSLEIVEKIKDAKRKKDLETEDILNLIKSELLNTLQEVKEEEITKKPYVIMVVGVNGSGKTTSIAKLANYYKEKGKKVLVAAADTFRAAASDQLSLWAEKLNVDIVKSQTGSDPASVVFDALSASEARNIDIVLIDTAGRLQNKTELMQELEKIKRVCEKKMPGTPHKIYLTLDATVGQNALDQAEIFNQFTPINGIILAKLDGSAKGGIVVAIEKKLHIPVVFAGVGEKIQDLALFDPKVFVEELLASEE
jgi:fused signal recognition particle receptor